LKSGTETLKSVWFWVFRTTFWQFLSLLWEIFMNIFEPGVFRQSRWAARSTEISRNLLT
jgi:hypothetical protein